MLTSASHPAPGTSAAYSLPTTVACRLCCLAHPLADARRHVQPSTRISTAVIPYPLPTQDAQQRLVEKEAEMAGHRIRPSHPSPGAGPGAAYGLPPPAAVREPSFRRNLAPPPPITVSSTAWQALSMGSDGLIDLAQFDSRALPSPMLLPSTPDDGSPRSPSPSPPGANARAGFQPPHHTGAAPGMQSAAGRAAEARAGAGGSGPNSPRGGLLQRPGMWGAAGLGSSGGSGRPGSPGGAGWPASPLGGMSPAGPFSPQFDTVEGLR